jgi:hypothetical protein
MHERLANIHRRPAIALAEEAGSVRLDVNGALDADLGDQLVELVRVARTLTPDVVLKLDGVEEWTEDGLDALSRCADLGARIPTGSSPRTAR